MDMLIKGMMLNNTVNVTAVSGKAMYEAARDTHNLSRVCTAVLGRLAVMTAMMSVQMKNDTDRITNILKGGGEAGTVLCTGRPDGCLKGYVDNPQVEIPLYDDKLDVAMAVGWFGDLTVVRDLHMKEPYIGKVAITSGEIAEDFAHYYWQSEQQPTLIYLGERIVPGDGSIRSAAGLMIAPLPNCPEESLVKLEEFAKSVSRLPDLTENKPLDDVLREIFEGMDFTETQRLEPRFFCDCSKERFRASLATLTADELCEMADEDKGAHVVCQFCNKEYDFTEQELREIIAQKDGGN